MMDLELLRSVRRQTDDLLRGYFNADGSPKDSFFESRRCPVCGTECATGRPVYKNNAGCSYVCCDICGMIYMNPSLKKEFTEAVYVKSKENTAKHQAWEKNLENGRMHTAPKDDYYSLLLKHTRGGVLLDFGCGFGKLANGLKPYFDKVEGVEIDTYCARRAAEAFGITIYNDFLENLGLDNKYDACMSINSIEHVYDPQKTVKNLYAVLKPKGILYLETPNIRSISMRLFGGKHHILQSQEHINLFSPDTLSRLLETAGFGIVECRTRKLDVRLNDLLVFFFSPGSFYHRLSAPVIPGAFYRKFTRWVDYTMHLLFEPIHDDLGGGGSYIQIVAQKT